MIHNPLKQIKNILFSSKTEDTRQKNYLQMLEKACEVTTKIFVNRNLAKWRDIEKATGINCWAITDDKLSWANEIDELNILGRRRIDNNYSNTIYEQWYEIDANTSLQTKKQINDEWKSIAKTGKKLLATLMDFEIPRECIYIKSSGRGLHFSVFTTGFRDAQQFTNALQTIMEASGINLSIKQSQAKGIIWGFDSAAITSSRRFIRELGGQNDKLSDITHYCSIVSTLDIEKYPFITKPNDVVYPTSINIFTVTKDFINKLYEHETTKLTSDTKDVEGTVVYKREGVIEKLYTCPLMKKIESDAKICNACDKTKDCHSCPTHLTNTKRVFLSQVLVFFGEAGEKEIHRILSLVEDYNEKYTQNQIDNIKRNNRKPITCEWAKKNNLCPSCSGIDTKSIVNVAWIKPKLETLREDIANHVKVKSEDKDVIDCILATGLEREYWPNGDAIWLYLIAASGSGKTELMRLMNDWKHTYTIDELTKASLISGFKPEEGTFGILGCFDGKSVYVKDMSQTLTSNKDERNAIFGTLRNVYDGYVEKGFGNVKEKTRIESKFGLFIGMTPIIDAYYTLSNQLGERFIKVRFACEENDVLSDIFDQQTDTYLQERKRLQSKVNEFLSSVTIRQYEAPAQYKELIMGLVKFTASMRTAVYVNSESDGTPSFRGEREMPSRVLNQAKKLWTIMACVRGKEVVDIEEINFVGKTLLQTPPLYRIQAFYHLLKTGVTSINSMADALHTRHEKAEQILEELYFLRIVTQNENDTYQLAPQFEKWGKEYDRMGWYRWLDNSYREFNEYKKASVQTNPEKRRERGLDHDWLTADNPNVNTVDE
ncbi:MAG: hypothetical protein WC365_07595 [Candidatus Babeliales bacterium]